MEKISYEDGFNVVVLQCDGCGLEIPQVERAEKPWFVVEVDPLARDAWNAGESLGEYHFCSTECFHDRMKELDPSRSLEERS